MRYSPSAQAARSTVLHRSEQKGRKGFPCQGVSLRQRGHGTMVIVFSLIVETKNPRCCGIPGAGSGYPARFNGRILTSKNGASQRLNMAETTVTGRIRSRGGGVPGQWRREPPSTCCRVRKRWKRGGPWQKNGPAPPRETGTSKLVLPHHYPFTAAGDELRFS